MQEASSDTQTLKSVINYGEEIMYIAIQAQGERLEHIDLS